MICTNIKPPRAMTIPHYLIPIDGFDSRVLFHQNAYALHISTTFVNIVLRQVLGLNDVICKASFMLSQESMSSQGYQMSEDSRVGQIPSVRPKKFRPRTHSPRMPFPQVSFAHRSSSYRVRLPLFLYLSYILWPIIGDV